MRPPAGYGEETPQVNPGAPPPEQSSKYEQASRLGTPTLTGPFDGSTPDISTPQGAMLPPGMETPRLEQGQFSTQGEVTPFIQAGGTGEMTPSLPAAIGGEITPRVAPPEGGEMTPRLPVPVAP